MYVITSVRDSVADNFLGLQLCQNDKVAVRGFIDAISDIPNDGSLLVKHPEDFELWRLGSFDEETGDIEPDCTLVLSGRLALRMVRGLDDSDDFEVEDLSSDFREEF